MPRDPYARFASYYDLLYEAKHPYEADVRWLVRAFRRFRPGTRSVLDLGCGTGNHAVRLASRGFEVVGVDRSARQLAVARRKSPARGRPVRWVRAGISRLSLGQTFDAAVCLFGAWDYLLTHAEVRRGLRAVRSHLAPGGLFLVEFWVAGGSAPRRRSWDLERREVTLLRYSESGYDPRTHRRTLVMHHLVYRGDRILHRFTDRHVLRTYEITEMRSLLESSGLRVLGIYRWDRPPRGFARARSKDFLAMAVARARRTAKA